MKLGEKPAAHEMQKTLLREEQEVTILGFQTHRVVEEGDEPRGPRGNGVPFPMEGEPSTLCPGGIHLPGSSFKRNCGRGGSDSGYEEKETDLQNKDKSVFNFEPPPTLRLCFYLHLQCLCVFHFGFMTAKA